MTMAVWQWAGIAWLATGLAVVCASRSAGTDGPLSQESILSSIALSAALILGAPFLLLFILGVCFQMLWRGSIPIISRDWWPARAAKFAVPPGPKVMITDWLTKRSPSRKLRPIIRASVMIECHSLRKLLGLLVF